jgi:hypothetical protein
MLRECKLIPSADDDRDWILDSYYKNKKNIISPISLNLESKYNIKLDSYETNNCNLNIGIIFTLLNQWFLEYNIKLKGRIIPSFIPSTENIAIRDVLEIFKIVSDKDDDNSIKSGTTDNKFIKNYARIYSIETLKNSLNDNGLALIILPIYENKKWISDYNSSMLYGEPFIVYGYNENGFLIKNNNGTEHIFLYKNWGCQWETWALLNMLKIKSRKSLGDLKKYLIENIENDNYSMNIEEEHIEEKHIEEKHIEQENIEEYTKRINKENSNDINNSQESVFV